MNRKTTFRERLKDGSIGEKIITDLLNKKNIPYTMCKDYRYDIKTKNYTIEVKTDFTKTPNVIIEYMENNTPRGIAKTKADIYCIVFINDLEIWLIEAPILKMILLNNNFKIIDKGNNGKMFCIPKKEIKHFFKIKPLNYEI